MQYSTVKPPCSNFRLITANFLGVRIFRIFTVLLLQGEEYVVREEWGEGLVGKHHPVICILDVDTEAITVLEDVPEEISPGLVSVL